MTSAKRLDKIDPTFASDLLSSDEDVAVVAELLRTGNIAISPGASVRPEDAIETTVYSDRGDLFAYNPIFGKLHIEVKRRGLHWTCEEDFPYPSVIVCSARRYNSFDPPPHCYVIFNEDRSGLIRVPCNTDYLWELVSREINGRKQFVYECPLEFCTFIPLKGVHEDDGTR